MRDASAALDASVQPQSRPRGRALMLLALLALAAIATRFWALGARPFHHDESIHAFQSWSLSRGGDWRYDPAYHGPLLYYVNALVYKVFGATDTTARLGPAVFGVLLLCFAWPLRRWIGNRAAAAYAVLALCAPHFVYFSRFIREDLYSLVFTFGTIVAFQRFLETDRAAWLTASAVAFALAGVTKENAYMTGVLFVVWGLWSLLERVSRRGTPRPGLAPAVGDTVSWIRARIGPLIVAGLVFLSIWALMYSAFGKYPHDWFAIPKAISYWMGQHSIARIPGPWWYYFPQLAYYETAILLFAALAFRPIEWKADPFLRTVLVGAPITVAYLVARDIKPLVFLRPHALIYLAAIGVASVYLALFRLAAPDEHRLTPFVRFVAYWAVASLAIYGWAREKVPWLTVHPLLPLTILAGIGLIRLWDERQAPWAKLTLAAGALLFAVNTSAAYLAAFRYGAHDVEKEPHHAEMLAYVQTTKDLVRSLSAVARAQARVAPGAPVVTVAGEGVWPLSWYLRDVPVNWASRIERADTPVIVADWDPEGALEKQLAPAYDAKRVPIRAWWFPEEHKDEPKDGKPGVTHPTASDFVRWWLFHEIWSPIGSQDAVIYVRKDIGGTGALEPLQITVQDTSSRDYPTEAISLPAARVFGSAAPGGLKEPRGLATDPQGNLYVADTKNSRIVVFDGNGGFVRAIGSLGEGDGQLKEACGVAIGPDGLVYVADTWNHRIARFTTDGQWKGAWTVSDPSFFGPRALVFAKGFLDVADTGNKRIVRLDAEGHVASTWGGAGTEPGRFVEPVGLATDPAGRIWVADTGNHRIQVFEFDGAFVRQFPVNGWKDFYTEPYLAAGPSDSVFATDSWKGRIAQYDANGALSRSFKAEGLKSPTGIVIDPFGRIVVSDRGTDRIYSWSLSDLMR
ncbi:MAG TPA: flippase activity-associated protein Agl23 [Thermoanaerobaculia bacterium]|nr:flippase activity-associated protein Agl23 [Thermoanaerobaculia bacterium]